MAKMAKMAKMAQWAILPTSQLGGDFSGGCRADSAVAL
jgi:hypothetical protein